MLLKKVLLGTVATAIALSTFSTTAKAQDPCGDRPYMAIRSALSMLKNHINKNAWEGSVAAGMQLNQFRTELEYIYRDKIKKDTMGGPHTLGTMTMLVNGYYDIKMGSSLYPYINLGIGASRLKQKDFDMFDHTDYKFSWGGGVGMGYDIMQNVTIDLGYRFLDLGKQVKSNEFYGGLRFSF
ncbi:MAG: porin family protein [Alphaproteobacteria bacterium]|nr:porin family protein [Alphaproteobacteria bacterium]MBO4643925.1 porin family protein [Alphaproteobacteria bacterium]